MLFLCLAWHLCRPFKSAVKFHNMQPRKLVESEASVLRELMLEAYAEVPHTFYSSFEERAAKPMSWWEGRLTPGSENEGLVFGVFSNEKLVGSASVDFFSLKKLSHKAVLGGMFVAKAYRKHGLGKCLVNIAFSSCVAKPEIRIVQLSTDAGNSAAISLYESCGFQHYGREPSAVFHQGQAVDHILMYKPIENR
jgi:RimJ/RimL family protein N-acetyltransferase